MALLYRKMMNPSIKGKKIHLSIGYPSGYFTMLTGWSSLRRIGAGYMAPGLLTSWLFRVTMT
ncbi:hypothetical protein [Enterocloster bolteae]|uniref:hypothetical protein n=1 Tax=Enterocloster bolteae TaxID=208479 RepID=UPI003BA92B58